MTNQLIKLSEAMAATVQAVGQGVVRVSARRRLPASGIIWAAEGLIITAHHVVQREDDIRIGLADGQVVAATLVGRDPSIDLALLRTEATGLTPPPWAEPETLQVGQLALALGRPGATIQATLGLISGLSNESWRTPVGGMVDRYLQTDVVMYPGFSGGPLVNAAGQVAGLNSSALRRGISLAVPTPTIRRLVETLLTHGRVRRGYLGLSGQPVRLPAAIATETGQETGLLVVAVEPDSPAEKGGLLLGDTIVALAGSPIRQIDDLLALLNADRVDETLPIRLLRGGQLQEITVAIGERT